MNARRLMCLLSLLAAQSGWAQTLPANAGTHRPLNLAQPRQPAPAPADPQWLPEQPRQAQGALGSEAPVLPYGSGFERRQSPGAAGGQGDGRGGASRNWRN